MPEKMQYRKHGDGRLIIGKSFYEPLRKKSREYYSGILVRILTQAKIGLPTDLSENTLDDTLLTLRQRFMISFSNGCPWPEKAIADYLEKMDNPPTTLMELREGIRKSGLEDGRNSFLFQNLLQFASKPLKEELLSYHPWKRLEKQEDRHLPDEITSKDGKGAYGIAHDPPFFEALKPLYKFIDEGSDKEVRNARHLAVIDFFEHDISKIKSIEELITKTEEFIKNPKYVEDYLPLYKQENIQTKKLDEKDIYDIKQNFTKTEIASAVFYQAALIALRRTQVGEIHPNGSYGLDEITKIYSEITGQDGKEALEELKSDIFSTDDLVPFFQTLNKQKLITFSIKDPRYIKINELANRLRLHALHDLEKPDIEAEIVNIKPLVRRLIISKEAKKSSVGQVLDMESGYEAAIGFYLDQAKYGADFFSQSDDYIMHLNPSEQKKAKKQADLFWTLFSLTNKVEKPGLQPALKPVLYQEFADYVFEQINSWPDDDSVFSRLSALFQVPRNFGSPVTAIGSYEKDTMIDIILRSLWIVKAHNLGPIDHLDQLIKLAARTLLRTEKGFCRRLSAK